NLARLFVQKMEIPAGVLRGSLTGPRLELLLHRPIELLERLDGCLRLLAQASEVENARLEDPRLRLERTFELRRMQRFQRAERAAQIPATESGEGVLEQRLGPETREAGHLLVCPRGQHVLPERIPDPAHTESGHPLDPIPLLLPLLRKRHH